MLMFRFLMLILAIKLLQTTGNLIYFATSTIFVYVFIGLSDTVKHRLEFFKADQLPIVPACQICIQIPEREGLF